MNSKLETTLITGGAGFIGSHLVDYFHDYLDHFVIIVDNLITGKIENIENKLSSDRIGFIQEDICRIPINKFGYVQIDNVLHLASLASPKAYYKYPLRTLRVGSLGTEVALKIAKKHNARFLISSTSEVYGDPLEHPQIEEYYGNVNPVGIRSQYDCSKRYAESLVMTTHKVFGVDTKIARIFNTFGDRLCPDDGRVISTFITQALNKEPLTVYGTGEQTRSICYIDDLIEGLLKLLYSNIHTPINLGNPDERTINELAKIVSDRCGNKELFIKYLPYPENDPVKRCPDITKAKTLLKWEPKISVEEGIEKTINYFKKEL